MFGNQTGAEFMNDWSNSDDSKFYLQAKENSGGGGNGGGNNNNQNQETKTTKETFDEMFPKK